MTWVRRWAFYRDEFLRRGRSPLAQHNLTEVNQVARGCSRGTSPRVNQISHCSWDVQDSSIGTPVPGANSRGAACLNTRPPPPLQPSPIVLEPVFLHFEILGERVGANGAEFFFFALREGAFFVFTLCVCTQNIQNFVEEPKMFETHREIFDP